MSIRSQQISAFAQSFGNAADSGLRFAGSVAESRAKQEQLFNSNKDVLETKYRDGIQGVLQELPESVQFDQYQQRVDSYNSDFVSKARDSGVYDEKTLSWLENEFMPSQAHRNEYAVAGVTDYAVTMWIANNANSKAQTLAADPRLSVDEASAMYKQYYDDTGLWSIQNGPNTYGYLTPDEFTEAIRETKALQAFDRIASDPDTGYMFSKDFNSSDAIRKACAEAGYDISTDYMREAEFTTKCNSELGKIDTRLKENAEKIYDSFNEDYGKYLQSETSFREAYDTSAVYDTINAMPYKYADKLVSLAAKIESHNNDVYYNNISEIAGKGQVTDGTLKMCEDLYVKTGEDRFRKLGEQAMYDQAVSVAKRNGKNDFSNVIVNILDGDLGLTLTESQRVSIALDYVKEVLEAKDLIGKTAEMNDFLSSTPLAGLIGRLWSDGGEKGTAPAEEISAPETSAEAAPETSSPSLDILLGALEEPEKPVVFADQKVFGETGGFNFGPWTNTRTVRDVPRNYAENPDTAVTEEDLRNEQAMRRKASAMSRNYVTDADITDGFASALDAAGGDYKTATFAFADELMARGLPREEAGQVAAQAAMSYDEQTTPDIPEEAIQRRVIDLHRNGGMSLKDARAQAQREFEEGHLGTRSMPQSPLSSKTEPEPDFWKNDYSLTPRASTEIDPVSDPALAADEGYPLSYLFLSTDEINDRISDSMTGYAETDDIGALARLKGLEGTVPDAIMATAVKDLADQKLITKETYDNYLPKGAEEDSWDTLQTLVQNRISVYNANNKKKQIGKESADLIQKNIERVVISSFKNSGQTWEEFSKGIPALVDDLMTDELFKNRLNTLEDFNKYAANAGSFVQTLSTSATKGAVINDYVMGRYDAIVDNDVVSYVLSLNEQDPDSIRDTISRKYFNNTGYASVISSDNSGMSKLIVETTYAVVSLYREAEEYYSAVMDELGRQGVNVTLENVIFDKNHGICFIDSNSGSYGYALAIDPRLLQSDSKTGMTGSWEVVPITKRGGSYVVDGSSDDVRSLGSYSEVAIKGGMTQARQTTVAGTEPGTPQELGLSPTNYYGRNKLLEQTRYFKDQQKSMTETFTDAYKTLFGLWER